MTISPLAKKALVGFVMVCALPCVLADGAASVMPSDEEWQQIKERWLAKPRRVIVDDDGCDALNFPEKEKQTVENFYAQMLDSMVGNAFDVLTYCPCTTGLAVLNQTRTGHRALFSLVDLHYTNITETLEREYGTDPLRLAHDFARSNGYEFVVNMRANDAHDAFYPPMLSDLKRRHPDYLVGSAENRPSFGEWSAFDFAVPEVRKLFKTLVCEWIDNYDPDGIMIDFRSHCLFKSVAWGGRPGRDEMDAYTDMVHEIRAYAESAGKLRRRPILFMFRIPDSIPICLLMGIDIVKWADEGLFDICIAGSDAGHYTLWRDMASFCREKRLKFYPSIDITWMKSSPEIFKRNCPEGFTGQIAAAYAAGADGVYLFNMFYEKSYFSKIRRDPAALAFCNKRYFVTTHMPRRVSAFQPMDGTDGIRSALYPEYPLLLASGGTHDYVIEVGDDFSVIADGSPPPTVRLHLKCSAKQGDELRVALNGTELRAMKSADSVLTFPVDPKSVVRGVNRLTLSAAGDVKPSRELVLSGDALIGPANRLKWRRLFPGNAVKGSESIVEGAYRLSTTDRNPVNLLYPIGNGCGQPLEAEFTLKVEPDSEPGSVVARLANGIGIEVFDFLPGRVRLRYAAHQCDFDTEKFHHYRARIEGGAVELWADGRRLLVGDVGRNASNVACHLRGQQYRIAGMDESSFLIGAVDPASGVGLWKDVSLFSSALAVSDAMLEVTFLPHVSPELLSLAHKGLPTVYDCDCTNGRFPVDPFVHNDYSGGFVPSANGKGILVDNDRNEYSRVWLDAEHPALKTANRYLSVSWCLRCCGEPRSSQENAFQVFFRFPDSQVKRRVWEGLLKMRDGTISTPFGAVCIAKGVQTVSVTVDCQTGEAAVLDGEGKLLTGGLLPRTNGTPTLWFGDGSSAVSGKVDFRCLRIGAMP